MSETHSSTEMTPFVFEGSHVIRMWLDDDHDVEAVAADLGAVLGIQNIRKSMQDFPLEERGVTTSYTPGGPQQLLTVRKGGFYRLIFQSRKPAAERFKSWVFNEILPQLRRQGTYTMPGARARSHIDAPREFTVAQLLCFWEVYSHQSTWYTTETLAVAAQVSVRRVRDYCRYFADLGLFERVHWHPLKQYRWQQDAAQERPGLVRAYVHAHSMLPRDLPPRHDPVWEREPDPRKW